MKDRIKVNSRTVAFTAAALTGLALVSGCSSTKKESTVTHYQSPAPVIDITPTQTPTGRSQMGTGQNQVVPLYQESVNVGKREVDAGTVRVKKTVKTETVNQPIELR